MEDQTVTATLPYPVSVNNVWLRSKTGTYLNPKVEIYRKEVWAILFNSPRFLDGKLKLVIKMYPPKQSCDIDNILKTLLDSLQHSGIIKNDSQVHELHVTKLDRQKGGKVEITLSRCET